MRKSAFTDFKTIRYPSTALQLSVAQKKNVFVIVIFLSEIYPTGILVFPSAHFNARNFIRIALRQITWFSCPQAPDPQLSRTRYSS